jgi:hypothetical protein
MDVDKRSQETKDRQGDSHFWPFTNISPSSFHQALLPPHDAEFVATHCRLTSPTLCYRHLRYFATRQSLFSNSSNGFPSAVDYLPCVLGYHPLSPFSFAPFSRFYLRPQTLSLFFLLFATHIPCDVTQTRVRSHQQRISAQRTFVTSLSPWFGDRCSGRQIERTAGSQHVACWEQVGLLT